MRRRPADRSCTAGREPDGAGMGRWPRIGGVGCAADLPPPQHLTNPRQQSQHDGRSQHRGHHRKYGHVLAQLGIYRPDRPVVQPAAMAGAANEFAAKGGKHVETCCAGMLAAGGPGRGLWVLGGEGPGDPAAPDWLPATIVLQCPIAETSRDARGVGQGVRWPPWSKRIYQNRVHGVGQRARFSSPEADGSRPVI